MASKLYSRYIPSSSKTKPAANPQVPSPLVVLHRQPTPPPTTKDASSTYSRYIPPSKSKSKQTAVQLAADTTSSVPLNSTKRKHGDFAEEQADPPVKFTAQKKVKSVEKGAGEKQAEVEPDTLVTTTADASVKVEKSKSKSKSRSKNTEVLKEKTDEEDARHSKLLEKREKSLKKGEKIAKKAAKDTHVEEIIEPPELHDLVPLPQPEPIPEIPLQPSSDSLPPWLANPIRTPHTASSSFINLGISKKVADGLQMKGFQNAFAVQVALLPLLLPGNSQQDGDFLVSAATGSGKTLAYVLPMIENISRYQITKLRGLIVLPTRELVAQAKEVSEMCAAMFADRKRLRIGTALGNENFKAEQASLMEQELIYDPIAFEKQLERLNSKWESSEYGSDEDLCDEELVSKLPGHVFNPVSKVDILICTPGRLVEHLKTTPGFTLENVQWLVVDEADKLLDQSFQDWVDTVFLSLKKPRKVILSATMTRDVGKLNALKLVRPKLHVIEQEGGQKEDSESLFLPSLLQECGIKIVDEDAKPLYLMEVLRRGGLISLDGEDITLDSSPTSSSESSSSEDSSDDSSDGSSDDSADKAADQAPGSGSPHGALIFTKSNESAIRLGRLISLLAPAFSERIGTLTSTTRSSDRRAALKSFEAGRLSILVASDLVSRGLDLPDLAHVINYDIPTSLTSYVHRVGRTARAGKNGHAWTLFTASEGRWFWNEIGRAEGVRRSGKVERITISNDLFQKERERYEAALEELGKESSFTKATR